MSRNLIRSALASISAALIVAALPAVAMAQTSASWTSTGATGNWSGTANWTPNTPPGSGGTASFPGGAFTSGGAASGYITAAVVITQDVSGLTLGGINFNNVANGFGYTIGTTNAITFVDNGSGNGALINLTANSNSNSNATGYATTVSVPITLNANLTFSSAANINLAYTFSGAISGSNGLIVTTTTAHDEAGFITLSSATSNFTGGVTLNSGSLQPGASTTGSAGAVTAGPLGTGTLTVNGGVLLTSTVTLANAMTLNANLTYAGGSGADTFSGVISGVGGITNQSRGSTLSLTNANTYNGPTLVQNEPTPITNAAPAVGTISLSGATGSALNSTSFTAQSGGTVLLDSSGIASAIARIGSSAAVNLNNGTFTIKSGTTTTTPTSFTQHAGILTGNGTNVVNISTATGAATTEGVDLDFSSLARAGNSTFLFNGTVAFGTAANGLGVSQLIFDTAPTLVGAGPQTGTKAAIIPYAVGSASATPTTGTGTDLVTYGTNGVTLLTAANYTTALTSGNAGTNVKLTATGTTITNNSNVSFQALVMSPATTADTLSGTGTLTFTSGTILSTFAGTNTINNNIAFGAQEAVLFVSNSLSENLQINGAISGTGGLTKGGPGVLILTPTSPYGNTYSGVTTLNGGLTLLTDQRAFGTDTSTVQLWGSTSGNNAGIQNTQAGLALNLTRNIGINDGNIALDATTARAATIVAGNISGGGGIWIADGGGFGMTILSGTNTFTGEVRVDSGLVGIGSDSNLGSGPSYDIGTNVTATNPASGLRLFGNLTTSKVLNITSSSTFNTGAFNMVQNGPVASFGTENLVKFGAGTLQFTNSQNGTTALTVDNGTVLVSGAGNLVNAAVGGIAINSGSLNLDYTTSTAPKLSTAQNVTFGGTPSGIQNGGGGTLQLISGTSAVNQQLGTITIPLANGTTSAASVASIVLNATAGGAITLNVASLTYSNSTNTTNSSLFVAGDNLGAATLSTGTHLYFNNNPTLVGGTYASANSPTIGILPGGYGDVTSGGAGTDLLTYDNTGGGVGVRLLNSNEYNFNTTGSGGNVNIQMPTTTGAADTVNAMVISGGTTLTVPSGGTLTVTSGTILSTGGTANVIAGTAGPGSNGGGTLQAGASSGFNFAVATDLTVNTVLLGGTGALIKVGPGTLYFDPLDASGNPATTSTLSSVNIYGGALSVVDPLSPLSVLGTGPFFMANNATFAFGGVGTSTSRVFNLYGSGGTLDLTGTYLQTNAASTQITGSGALTLAGGTLVIGANNAQANAYLGGTNVNGGTLLLDSTNAAGLGLGVLNLNGGQIGPFQASRTISANETAIYANTTFVNNQTVGATVDSSKASLTFSVPARLEGSVTLTNNMIGVIGNSGASSGVLTFSGSIYDDPFIAASTLTLASGTGAGPFIFSASNSYRGGTTIGSGATLQVINSGTGVGSGSGTGSGSVTVASTGTLQGTGYIFPASGKNLTVNSGGIIQPGYPTAVGTLTVGTPAVNAPVTINGTYLWNLAITGSSAAVGTGGSDATNGESRLVVNGNLTADWTLSLDEIGTSTFNNTLPYSWVLATTPGSATITFAQPTFIIPSDYTPDPAGAFYYVSSGTFGTGLALFLNYQPVPEPGTMLLLGAAGVGGLGWYRRRRAAAKAAV